MFFDFFERKYYVPHLQNFSLPWKKVCGRLCSWPKFWWGLKVSLRTVNKTIDKNKAYTAAIFLGYEAAYFWEVDPSGTFFD